MSGIFCLHSFSFLGYACVFVLVLWFLLIQLFKYHDYVNYSMISDLSFSYFFRPFEPGYLHFLLLRGLTVHLTQGLALLKNIYTTVEPRFNEGPKKLAKFVRYIEVLFHIFYHYWGKENCSLYRGLRYIEVRYIEVPLYLLCGLVCQ